jgi:hypothetical protein
MVKKTRKLGRHKHTTRFTSYASNIRGGDILIDEEIER